MPDETRRIFAPTPKRLTFVLLPDRRAVDVEIYDFLDVPLKDAQTVYHLEDEIQAATGFSAIGDLTAKVARLLCPGMDQTDFEALSYRQLQDLIAASHGIASPSPEAEGKVASLSASAVSTTPSP